ncbi:MAG: hypothetical protein IT371_30565 [Deltaproteobacteria bacterium]|nr:hypothetical protein [Deltaproteobacteria bacterium]
MITVRDFQKAGLGACCASCAAHGPCEGARPSPCGGGLAGEKESTIGGGVAAGAVAGATVGAAAGPWGAAIGAAAGAIAGGAMGYAGKEKARKAKKKQRRQAFAALQAEEAEKARLREQERQALVAAEAAAIRRRTAKQQIGQRGAALAKRAEAQGLPDLADEAREIAEEDVFLGAEDADAVLADRSSRLTEIDQALRAHAQATAEQAALANATASALGSKKNTVRTKARLLAQRATTLGVPDLAAEATAIGDEDVYLGDYNADAILTERLARLDEIGVALARYAVVGRGRMSGLGGMSADLGAWLGQVRQSNRVRAGLPPGRVPSGSFLGDGNSAPSSLGMLLVVAAVGAALAAE